MLIGFSPDSQRFAARGGDGRLRVGDVRSGSRLWETNVFEDSTSNKVIISAVSFGPDGLLAVAGRRNLDQCSLAIWDERQRRRLLSAGTNVLPFVMFPEFTPDGRFLVAQVANDPAGNDARIAVCRVERIGDGVQLHHLITTDASPSKAAIGGRRIAYASSARRSATPDLHLVELDGPLTDRIIGQGAPGIWGLECLAFTADGRRLLSFNTNRVIVALDVATGNVLTPPLPVVEDSQRTNMRGPNFSLSPDDSKLAVYSQGESGVAIWDWKTRRLLYSIPYSEPRLFTTRWSPDSQHLAIYGFNSVVIWHLRDVERALAEVGLGTGSKSKEKF